LYFSISPDYGSTARVTVYGGSAMLQILGFSADQYQDFSNDFLHHKNITSSLVVKFGAITYTQGYDYTYNPETGELRWTIQVTGLNVQPSAGEEYQVTYAYHVLEEVRASVSEVKQASDIIVYKFL
jgi:hypothetical protein